MLGLAGAIFAPKATRSSAGVPSYGMIPPLGSVQSTSGLLISQATAMAVATVYACVRRRAIDVARCKPSLYTLKDDGSRVAVTGHPLLKLFERPNRQQNWLEWMEQQEVGYLLRGNAYSPVRRDGKGDPIELVPVNPDAVMVLEAGDGSIFYNVNRIGLWQIAMLRDFPSAIAEEDMLHLRGLTFNALVGVSTIGLGRDAIGLSMALEQQVNRFVGNGARPATWLKTASRLSEIAANRLKAQFDQLHGGLQNVGRTVVLEEGIEPVPLQLSSVDIEMIQNRNLQVLEICRFFGVPPHKVFADANARSSSQNIAQQDQDYVNSTVTQDLERWESKFRQYFELDEEGIYVDLDENQLLRADILTRRNAARLGILSGEITPNEARREDGYGPIEGGNKLLVPANTAALGSDMTGTAPDGAGRPAEGSIAEPGASTGGDQPGAKKVKGEQGRDMTPAAPIHLNVDARRGGRKVMHMRKSLDGSVRVEIEETEDA